MLKDEVNAPSDRLLKGVAWMLLSSLCFALMGFVSKVIGPYVSLGVVLCFSSIICLVLTLPRVWQFKKELFFPEHVGLMAFRGCCGFLSYALLFVAIQKIPLVDAYLLNYASPLLVPVVALVWTKTPLSKRIWPGLILGFIGVIFVLRPSTAIFTPGAFLALGAALVNAIVIISVRLLTRVSKTSIVMFYNFLVAALISVPWAVMTYEPIPLKEWLLLFTLGLFMFLGVFFAMKALQYGHSTFIAPFNLTANIYAGLLSWIVWGKAPDLYTIGGFLGILAGGALTILGGRIPILPAPQPHNEVEKLPIRSDE